MTKRDVLNTVGPGVFFLAALLLNDAVMERRIGALLLARPEIVSNALAQAQSQRTAASAARMQQQLVRHWDVLSQTHAYAVRFDGSRFTSRLVRIADVATPKNLNLIATDYRCGFCKADRDAVDALLRANPRSDFVFIEAAILGSDSTQLAEEALLRAQHGEADYYFIHNRQFDAPARLSSGAQVSGDSANVEVALLAEQKKFLDIVGVSATPTYVRDGLFRAGSLGTPDG